MGKNLISQKRGKGSTTYTRPSFNFKGQSKIGKNGKAIIVDFLSCRAHSAPLATLHYQEEDSYSLVVAPEGVRIGQEISIGGKNLATGNILELKNIPEGTNIFNIENKPGDGGKFVRSSGMSAKLVAKSKGKITVLLPSKKKKEFNPECRACIGVVAGGGRPEKPFYKAGKKFHAMKAKNIYWPQVGGVNMNAVDHPFGGASSHHKGKPTIAPKNAPPGKVAGSIRPRKTGKKR
jgi:large subunit ribosomal protein L2